MLRRLVAGFFLALFVALGGAALYAFWPVGPDFDPAPLLARAARYDVHIRRDGWGVPYVHGRTDADVAYGLAFAHAEDDFLTIQKVLLATRGRLATVDGFDAAPLDYVVQLMGFWKDVDARYESDLSPATRALAEAYADGINHYAALHPREVLPGVVPVRGRDIVAGFAMRTPLFYGLERTIRRLFDDEHPPELALAPTDQAFHLVRTPQPPLGSNAVAVAPSRSADGATRLLVNSHQPWTGPVAWYEARLQSDAGWNMVGGVFPGSPVILHGTGPTLGWASTVNSPDLADVYELTVNPDDDGQYLLDGHWRDFERDQAEISVKLFGRLRWTVHREVLRSVHGPVLRRPTGTWAVRYVGMHEIRQLEQYYRMNRATTFAEWRDAMRMQALPSINFVYADRKGNIAYYYNAKFPRRVPGWDYSKALPGDRSDLIWTSFWPFDAVPKVVNPSTGFVASANQTPFRTTLPPDAPHRADFPPEDGIEHRMTNRALRELELYGGDSSITRKEFFAYKYDKRYSQKSRARQIRDQVLAAGPADWGDDPPPKEALDLLAKWDLSADVHSRTAALGILTATPVVVAEMRGLPVPNPLDTFRAAIDSLRRHHGRLDPEWGEVNRMRRGKLDLPAGGGPDVMRAIEAFTLDPDGTYTAKTGDSYVMFVEWDAQGHQRVNTIHQFGTATLDEDSPHYADQMPIFLAEGTKEIPLTEEALAPQVVADYRPGARPEAGTSRLAR